MQLEDLWAAPTPPVPGFVSTASASAATVNSQGADGKEAIIDAQDSEQFLDERTDKAQTRLPYSSTLLQMDYDSPESRFLQSNIDEFEDDGETP